MGCTCSNNDNENELFYERISQYVATFENNPDLLKSLVKTQSAVRGHIVRKRLKAYKEDIKKKEEGKNRDIVKYESNPNTIPLTKELQNDYKNLLIKYPIIESFKFSNLKLKDPVQYKNNVVYYGEWDENEQKRCGRGVGIWLDGSKYLGYWDNDMANIKGKLIHNEGDTYEGEWKNDKPDGYGVYTHSDGAKYEGYWKEDKQEGKGKETWPDGAVYEGNYKNGKKDGEGTFKWSDGSQYIGQFKDNNISGKGKYIWSDYRQYTGDWKNNKMDGYGEFIWPDGRKYTGNYVNDQKSGFGTFEDVGGKIYRGMWANGQQNGEGELFDPKTNLWRKGEWLNGRRIRWSE